MMVVVGSYFIYFGVNELYTTISDVAEGKTTQVGK